MPAVRVPARRIDALTVAHLFTVERITKQKTIARMLGMDDAQVNRLLKMAREEGWIARREQLTVALSAQDRRRIEARVFSARLRETLEKFARHAGVRPVRTVRVLPSISGDWDRRLHEFGQAAAGVVLDLIAQSRVLGVAWGSTPASVVEGMRNLAVPRRRLPRSVIPICGEPLAGDLTETSASKLARDLAVTLRGNPRYAISLHNVPALIPADFSDEEIDVVYKLISRVPAYGDVFGASDPGPVKCSRILDDMDTVLTSISAADQPWGSRSGALLESAGISAKALRTLCIGDVGGVLIPAGPDDTAVGTLMRRWTGIQLDDLRRIADTGQVILVAIGENKGRVLLEVLRQGLCTHLLVDSDLFESLTHLIHADARV